MSALGFGEVFADYSVSVCLTFKEKERPYQLLLLIPQKKDEAPKIEPIGAYATEQEALDVADLYCRDMGVWLLSKVEMYRLNWIIAPEIARIWQVGIKRNESHDLRHEL